MTLMYRDIESATCTYKYFMNCRIFKMYFGAVGGFYKGELCKGCLWLKLKINGGKNNALDRDS